MLRYLRLAFPAAHAKLSWYFLVLLGIPWYFLVPGTFRGEMRHFLHRRSVGPILSIATIIHRLVSSQILISKYNCFTPPPRPSVTSSRSHLPCRKYLQRQFPDLLQSSSLWQALWQADPHPQTQSPLPFRVQLNHIHIHAIHVRSHSGAASFSVVTCGVIGSE